MALAWGCVSKPSLKPRRRVRTGWSRDLINWDIWPPDCWPTSCCTHSCVLDSLTVIFFAVLLHGDLHFSLRSFAVRVTIWGEEERQSFVKKNKIKIDPWWLMLQDHQAELQLDGLYIWALGSLKIPQSATVKQIKACSRFCQHTPAIRLSCFHFQPPRSSVSSPSLCEPTKEHKGQPFHKWGSCVSPFPPCEDLRLGAKRVGRWLSRVFFSSFHSLPFCEQKAGGGTRGQTRNWNHLFLTLSTHWHKLEADHLQVQPPLPPPLCRGNKPFFMGWGGGKAGPDSVKRKEGAVERVRRSFSLPEYGQTSLFLPALCPVFPFLSHYTRCEWGYLGNDGGRKKRPSW